MSGTLFAILAFDAPGSDAKRAEHRDGHLAHFRAHAAMIAVGGPLGGTASGSLVIVEAESEEEARAFIEADPFHAAGVWENVRVHASCAGSGYWPAS
jgi:uncharacterized protein